MIALSSLQLEVLESDVGDLLRKTVNAGARVGARKDLSFSLGLVTASVKSPSSSIPHARLRL